MTLDNKGGQVVGVDERAGALWLMQTLGMEHAEELIEEMYPTSGKEQSTTPNRAAEPEACAADCKASRTSCRHAEDTARRRSSWLTIRSKTESAWKRWLPGFDRLKEALRAHLKMNLIPVMNPRTWRR